MASKIIGRTACPECGFESAHVKQSEKCIFRYCPECSSQHHARSERQRENLLKQTRLLDAPAPAAPPEPAPEPAPAPPTRREPTQEPTPTPTPTPTRRPSLGLFGR